MTEIAPPESAPPAPHAPSAPAWRLKINQLRRALWGLAGAVVIFGVWLVFHSHGAGRGPDASRLPVVAVETIERENLAQTLALSAEFRPYQEVALHPKIAGYLQSISVDVGDHVHEGDTIAKLDVPELKDEVGKASAALGASEQEVTRAEAAYADVHVSTQRLQQVAKEHPKLVAQQDVDTALARDATSASAVAAARQKVEEAQAEVSRVKAMLAYTSITAPFDGVITKRLADTGALIQAGTSGGQSTPLVELAEDKRLRLVFPVPESAVSLVKNGASVRVSVGALGQTFDGKVSRYSDKVDHATRTMWTEVDVENPDGRFKPGMIAVAELRTQERQNAVVVPIQALSLGEKPTALMVNLSDVVELRPVKLGLETPYKVEVLKGLEPGERVIVGSHAGLQPGQKVSAKLVPAIAPE